MTMFSPEEILTLQQDNEQENDVICPILVSSIAKNETELGIEVTPLNITAPSDDDSELAKKYFSVIDPVDKNIWYQIKSIDRTSYLLKLKLNVCVWDQPCFFPLLVTSMCYCNDTIIVGLEDSSIQFIDAEFGLPCLPAMRVEGGIRYLRSFANNLILCISQKKTVTIWSLTNPAELHDVLHVQYYGEMPEIKKVEITNELPNGDISPIIFFKDFAVRWSKSANFWVGYNVKFPRFLIPPTQIQTLADLERQFTDSLIYHDGEKFYSTYFELFDFYLQDPSGNNALILVKQMLARKSEDLEKYCDIPMQELYDKTLNLIAEHSPEMLEKIKETKEYQDANRPKPAPTEVVQHHKKSRSRSKLEDDESDDTDINFPEEEENSDEIALPEEEDSQEEETSKKRKKAEEPQQIEIPELPPIIPQKPTSITQSLSHFLELSNGFDNWDKTNASTNETANNDKPIESTNDQETKQAEQAAPIEEIVPVQAKAQTPKKTRQSRKVAKLEIPLQAKENIQLQSAETDQTQEIQSVQEQPIEVQSTSTMTTRMQTRRGSKKVEAPKPAPKPRTRRGKAVVEEAPLQAEVQTNNISLPLSTVDQPETLQNPVNESNIDVNSTEQNNSVAAPSGVLPQPVETKPKKQTKRATTPKRNAKNTKVEPLVEPTEPIKPDELLQFKINVPQVNIDDVSKVETIEANELPTETKTTRIRITRSPSKNTPKKEVPASPVIAKQMVEDEIKKKLDLEKIKQYEEELKKQKEAEEKKKLEELNEQKESEIKQKEEELKVNKEEDAEADKLMEEEKKLIEEKNNEEIVQMGIEEQKRIEEENKQKENDEKKANDVFNDEDDVSKVQLEISKKTSPKGKPKASPKGKTTKGHPTKQKQIELFFK